MKKIVLIILVTLLLGLTSCAGVIENTGSGNVEIYDGTNKRDVEISKLDSLQTTQYTDSLKKVYKHPVGDNNEDKGYKSFFRLGGGYTNKDGMERFSITPELGAFGNQPDKINFMFGVGYIFYLKNTEEEELQGNIFSEHDYSEHGPVFKAGFEPISNFPMFVHINMGFTVMTKKKRTVFGDDEEDTTIESTYGVFGGGLFFNPYNGSLIIGAEYDTRRGAVLTLGLTPKF